METFSKTNCEKIINIVKLLFLGILAIALRSCANISPPGGGPKDLKAPLLIKSSPFNNSKNFTGQKLVFQFNERIAVNNINDELIINPAIKGSFKNSIRKNILYLTFDEPFNPNTTYTFNFREAIKDITENNITKNLKLAFSTGNDLDTASFDGNANDLLSNIPLKDILISLYLSTDTLNVKNSKPLYLTKTDKNGNFSINNIKAKTYDVYALTDNNKNYIYDNENEKISFQKNLYIDSITQHSFFLAKNQFQDISIISKRSVSSHEAIINLNKGLKLIKVLNNTHKLLIKPADNAKSISFYTLRAINDSISTILYFEDSLGLNKIDTVNLYFNDPNKGEKNKDVHDKNSFIKKTKPSDRSLIEGKLNFTLEFYKPVIKYLQEMVSVKKDSITIKNNKIKSFWDSSYTFLTLSTEIPFKDSLVLLFPKGTFVNFENDTNNREKYIFTNKKEQDYAILDGKVDTKETSYILQLIDGNFQIVEQCTNCKKFNFSYLIPGVYYLRAIQDTNRNNQWDAGSLSKNIQPEAIFFYKEKFTLRANWEITGIEFKF